MKPYINFNTQKRKEATNEADKNIFKLLNKIWKKYGKYEKKNKNKNNNE